MKIFKQVMEGLENCHRNKMVHRDLKPSNILLSKNGEVAKICDFGFSKLLKHDVFSSNIGTEAYKAPEFSDKKFCADYKVDIWAAGCIFY